jgi:hypothetical protein
LFENNSIPALRRYSNVTELALEPILNKDFLISELPVKLTPELTHTELAKAFARLIHNQQVYVYDLVVGSPFFTYPNALVAIGISKKPSAIKRNIDTGKVFKGRYLFYSVNKNKN